MKIGILGAGLSGISLAYFLQDNDKISSIEILEKEQTVGGLCRSFELNGVHYDIGPHIVFSKNDEILNLMLNLLGKNVNRLKRSNKIFYKGSFVKYPFENELSALPDEDKQYCLNSFLNNSYESYKPQNMLHFFLTTFGEGITNCYLRPYNEKIWKFDPAFMDLQMVGRIPKPPQDDIINSANGASTEGYLHQLYFYYPKVGGIDSLIKVFRNKFNDKVNVIVNSNVVELQKNNNKWEVKTDTEAFGRYDMVVSTVPVQLLVKMYKSNIPEEIISAVSDLKYNSIIIVIVNAKKDNLGNNFAVMVPDRDIIFHRVSKLNFLGEGYCKEDGSTTLMVEITYRKDSTIDKMSNKEVERKILDGLEDIRFIDDRAHVNFIEIRRLEYAYVIYDLNHNKNMHLIRSYFTNHGIMLCGRFGEFEYLNMDSVIRQANEKSNKIIKEIV